MVGFPNWYVTAGDVNINITYDALNRRVEKRVYINDMLNKTTENIYDNWQVIEERSGANVKSFVYGDYIDEVVYFENSEVGYYPLRGVNYNVEGFTNSSGDLVETYAIDAFGNFKVFDADGVEKGLSDRLNSILHQGRDYDDDVGLYYFRNRWYSAEQGRFISRDPIRYRAEDVNLYRFVGNWPFINLDPYGLMSQNGSSSDFCEVGKWIANQFFNSSYEKRAFSRFTSGRASDIVLTETEMLDAISKGYNNRNTSEKLMNRLEEYSNKNSGNGRYTWNDITIGSGWTLAIGGAEIEAEYTTEECSDCTEVEVVIRDEYDFDPKIEEFILSKMGVEGVEYSRSLKNEVATDGIASWNFVGDCGWSSFYHLGYAKLYFGACDE